MLPHISALTVTVDGILTVIGVASGAVPTTAATLNGFAVSPSGSLYVVYV